MNSLCLYLHVHDWAQCVVYTLYTRGHLLWRLVSARFVDSLSPSLCPCRSSPRSTARVEHGDPTVRLLSFFLYLSLSLSLSLSLISIVFPSPQHLMEGVYANPNMTHCLTTLLVGQETRSIDRLLCVYSLYPLMVTLCKQYSMLLCECHMNVM